MIMNNLDIDNDADPIRETLTEDEMSILSQMQRQIDDLGSEKNMYTHTLQKTFKDKEVQVDEEAFLKPVWKQNHDNYSVYLQNDSKVFKSMD